MGQELAEVLLSTESQICCLWRKLHGAHYLVQQDMLDLAQAALDLMMLT